jgi:hypothetical protein
MNNLVAVEKLALSNLRFADPGSVFAVSVK